MRRRLSDRRVFIPLIVAAFALSVVVVGLMIPRMASRFIIEPVGGHFVESNSRSGVVYDTWRRGGDVPSAAGLRVSGGMDSDESTSADLVFQYDADLSVEVADVAVTSLVVREEVERRGGYVESFVAGGSGHDEYAEMVLRVPVDYHSSVMSMIRSLGSVVSEREIQTVVAPADSSDGPEITGLQALLDAHVAQLPGVDGRDREKLLETIAYLQAQNAEAAGLEASTATVLYSTVVLHLVTGSAVEIFSRLENGRCRGGGCYCGFGTVETICSGGWSGGYFGI